MDHRQNMQQMIGDILFIFQKEDPTVYYNCSMNHIAIDYEGCEEKWDYFFDEQRGYVVEENEGKWRYESRALEEKEWECAVRMRLETIEKNMRSYHLFYPLRKRYDQHMHIVLGNKELEEAFYQQLCLRYSPKEIEKEAARCYINSEWNNLTYADPNGNVGMCRFLDTYVLFEENRVWQRKTVERYEFFNEKEKERAIKAYQKWVAEKHAKKTEEGVKDYERRFPNF